MHAGLSTAATKAMWRACVCAHLLLLRLWERWRLLLRLRLGLCLLGLLLLWLRLLRLLLLLL